jgi:predicted enzyme related to lactoylglutathione lyase
MSNSIGKPVWFEVVTPDAEATTRFYSEVLGWTPVSMNMGGGSYTMFQSGENRPQSGIADWKPEGQGYWVGYLEAGDINAALERVKKHGGKINGDVIHAPGVGKMAPVSDPQGGAFFIFQGEQLDDSPYDSAPGKFHWFELMVPDAEAVLPFYRGVFNYDIETMPMESGPYHVFNSGGTSRGGAMSIPDNAKGMPALWQPYVNVDDVDAAVERVIKNGGTACMEAMDVPYVGRLCIVADPHGAMIGVMTPAPGPEA